MQRNNIKRKQRRGTESIPRGMSNLGHVPPFTPTLMLSHKFRFVNGANAGAYIITRGNLLNLVLVATSAVTTVRLFQAVRLRLVEVWTNPSALGSPPTTTSLEWLGVQGSSTQRSDTTMGVTPSHIVCQPPRNSSDVWWSINGMNESDQMFELFIAANSVVDVTLELRMLENESPTAGDIPAGAALGQQYGDYLDGLASGKLSPLGFIVLP